MFFLGVFSSRTEKDKAPPSPYLTINNKGDVEVQNDQVLVSTCRMHIYNFPFDIQSCSLSFKSVIHTGEHWTHNYKSLLSHYWSMKHQPRSHLMDLTCYIHHVTARDIRLQPSDNSSEATEWSREVMRTQYEWLFINMTVTSINASDSFGQDLVVYTVGINRYRQEINSSFFPFPPLYPSIPVYFYPSCYLFSPVFFFKWSSIILLNSSDDSLIFVFSECIVAHWWIVKVLQMVWILHYKNTTILKRCNCGKFFLPFWKCFVYDCIKVYHSHRVRGFGKNLYCWGSSVGHSHVWDFKLRLHSDNVVTFQGLFHWNIIFVSG